MAKKNKALRDLFRTMRAEIIRTMGRKAGNEFLKKVTVDDGNDEIVINYGDYDSVMSPSKSPEDVMRFMSELSGAPSFGRKMSRVAPGVSTSHPGQVKVVGEPEQQIYRGKPISVSDVPQLENYKPENAPEVQLLAGRPRQGPAPQSVSPDVFGQNKADPEKVRGETISRIAQIMGPDFDDYAFDALMSMDPKSLAETASQAEAMAAKRKEGVADYVRKSPMGQALSDLEKEDL